MYLPLLLTRDDDDDVRVLPNVCRHRGATLEREAAGCKRVFTWVIAEPDVAHMPGIDARIGALGADFDWIGLPDHRIAAIEQIDIAANWKLLIEGGLEAYHFRVAHKDTIGPYFPDNLLIWQSFGPHIRAMLPRNSMPDLGDAPEADWHLRRDANLVYLMMVNTQPLVQQDHVMWFHFEPVSEALTRVRMATLVPNSAPRTPEMQAHWDKNQRITVIALMEDFELGEEIQSGFASRGNPSHLFGRFEGALDRFNRVVEEMIAG
ncbi:SRPBCC family protein [Roseobacter sp. HKCCA0434]|uniref:SRPBCC family protein n=1 Tax=Roseobacter sp. HKCCA0434 TaxID=3079297 RepID=UPI003966FC15